ncbi:hypothetical protein GH733_009941 [Mirounga leonina]|nr:hypothetical protein GH733_009941 [Mirounga leonina]
MKPGSRDSSPGSGGSGSLTLVMPIDGDKVIAVKERDRLEFDVEGEKLEEAANMTGPGGAPGQGDKYTAHCNNYRCYPHHRGPQAITRIVTMRGRRKGQRGRAQQHQPNRRHSSHLSPVPTLLSRKKGWRVLTTRVQENKVDH